MGENDKLQLEDELEDLLNIQDDIDQLFMNIAQDNDHQEFDTLLNTDGEYIDYDRIKNDILDPVITITDHFIGLLYDQFKRINEYEQSLDHRVDSIKQYEEFISLLSFPIHTSVEIKNYTNLSQNYEVNDYANAMNDVYVNLKTIIDAVKNRNVYIGCCDLPENQIITDTEYIKKMYDYFRQGKEKIYDPYLLTANQVKNIYYNIERDQLDIRLTLLKYDILNTIDTMLSIKPRLEDIDLHTNNAFLSSTQMVYYRKYVYRTLHFLYQSTLRMMYFMIARIDAVIESSEFCCTIMMDTIDQINATIHSDDLNTDIESGDNDDLGIKEYNMEMYCIDNSFHYDTIYAESAIMNEGAGLIYIEEGLKDVVAKYMDKVITGTEKVIQKVHAVINKKIAKKLKKNLDKLDSTEKPDPDFKIKNYKKYNLDVMDDIKPVPFNYVSMREDLKSRDEFIKKYYPKLYNENEKNIYNVLMKQCLIGTEDSVPCTKELIDNCKLYCTEGYKEYLENNESYLKLIQDARKSAESIAGTVVTSTPSPNEINATVASTTSTKESSDELLLNEEEVTTKAVTKSATKPVQTVKPGSDNKDDNKTGFEDDEKADKREGNTELMRALTMYCSITTKIITARIRVVNQVFNDRVRILSHYIIRNGWNSKKKKEKTVED